MTPPPAATHAARTGALNLRPARVRYVPSSVARVLSARAWARLRFLVDVVVLYLASSAALFADAPVRNGTENHLVAAAFPLVALVILHIRQAPAHRPSGSLLETASTVI